MNSLERNLLMKIRAISSPLSDEAFIVHNVRLSAKIYPPLPLRRMAELFGTFGKLNGFGFCPQFADSLR